MLWLSCTQPWDQLEVLKCADGFPNPHIAAQCCDADPLGLCWPKKWTRRAEPSPTSFLVTRGAGTLQRASSGSAEQGDDNSSTATPRTEGAPSPRAKAPMAPPVSCASVWAPADLGDMNRLEGDVNSSNHQLLIAGGTSPGLKRAYMTRDKAETVASGTDNHFLLRQFSTVASQPILMTPEDGPGVEARCSTWGLPKSVLLAPSPSVGVLVLTAPSNPVAVGVATM